MKYIGFILLAVIIAIILLLLIAVLRTLLMPSKTSTYVAEEPEEESLVLAQKLSKMIQYDTTSYANVAEVEKFLGFHKVLEELFPLVHEKLEKTEIDGNLLFYWKGKSSEKPILLMSHQDVVPAEGEWIHAPFSGDIAEGKVWGRGASDTKCSVMAFFQAVEELLAEGFIPPTDVYLASSCTEEWGGECTEDRSGAAAQGELNCSWYVMRAVVSSRSPSVESTVILPWWEYLKKARRM